MVTSSPQGSESALPEAFERGPTVKAALSLRWGKRWPQRTSPTALRPSTRCGEGGAPG